MKTPRTSLVPLDHLRFVCLAFLLLVGCFTAVRLVLFASHAAELAEVPVGIILQSLIMGLRFDAVVSGYIFAFPLILLAFGDLLPWKAPMPGRLAVGVAGLLGTVALLLVVIALPFYAQYHSPLTVAILDWSDQPGFVLRMLLTTVPYYLFLALFLLLSSGYVWGILRLGRPLTSGIRVRRAGRTWGAWSRSLICSLLTLAALVLAMRGRVTTKSPIRWGTAYFSTYTFPNHAGLNPVFTFFQSWLDKGGSNEREVQLLANEEAIRRVREAFGIAGPQLYESPIARSVRFAEAPKRMNVILILMESMAARKMGRYGYPGNPTPSLDSLARNGIAFDRFYSAGIHTFNGVYSSLFGLPAVLGRHPMKHTESIQPFAGLARVCGASGYRTAYFCTHDAEFDNMAGFLTNNGFQQIVSQQDYPRAKVESVLGVPDHVMFEEAMPRLRELAGTGSPFFAAFLTASDHIPYVIPEGIPFKVRSAAPEAQIVEYADWSIGHFMELASRESWYANTLFVFVADHGSIGDTRFEISLDYHHEPFILWSTEIARSPRAVDRLGEQVDIGATLLGQLRLPYLNNTLGMDLFRERRPFVFFNDDDVIGCLDENWFLVRHEDGRESLFRYADPGAVDHRSEQSAHADSMSQYARAMFQATQWLVKKRLVGVPEAGKAR